jgi:hypothetical protein
MAIVLRLSFVVLLVALAVPLWGFLHAYPLFCAGLGSGMLLMCVWYRVNHGHWPLD